MGDSREHVLDELAKAAGEEAARMYRTAEMEAAALIRAELAKDHKLLKAIDEKMDATQVRRMRVYEDAVKRARKALYYGLRRFNDEERQESLVAELESLALLGKPSAERPEGSEGAQRREGKREDKEESREEPSITPGKQQTSRAWELVHALLETHASTRERAESLAEFHAQLFGAVDLSLTNSGSTLSRVLDIGCGCYPLSFPCLTGVAEYVAADPSKPALRVLEAAKRALALHMLKPRAWSACEGWEPLFREGTKDRGRSIFDLALMLKLVPLIERQEPESLLTLAAVPARLIVVTGSKVGLARKDSIETRERKSLERFAAMTGARVIGEIDAGEEIGLVMRREA